MTGIEMCQVISDYWKEARGVEAEPLKIWESSPTGELFQVFMWYDEACAYNATKEKLGPLTDTNKQEFGEDMVAWFQSKIDNDLKKFHKSMSKHREQEQGNA